MCPCNTLHGNLCCYGLSAICTFIRFALELLSSRMWPGSNASHTEVIQNSLELSEWISCEARITTKKWKQETRDLSWMLKPQHAQRSRSNQCSCAWYVMCTVICQLNGILYICMPFERPTLGRTVEWAAYCQNHKAKHQCQGHSEKSGCSVTSCNVIHIWLLLSMVFLKVCMPCSLGMCHSLFLSLDTNLAHTTPQCKAGCVCKLPSLIGLHAWAGTVLSVLISECCLNSKATLSTK